MTKEENLQKICLRIFTVWTSLWITLCKERRWKKLERREEYSFVMTMWMANYKLVAEVQQSKWQLHFYLWFTKKRGSSWLLFTLLSSTQSTQYTPRKPNTHTVFLHNYLLLLKGRMRWERIWLKVFWNWSAINTILVK
jgi:hypothetical protein